MAGANLGVGLGVKNIRIVFIFLSKEDFIKFKDNRWVGGLQADATAKSKNKGGANDVQTDMSGVQTYVITKKEGHFKFLLKALNTGRIML